ncbi:MAG: hypothetical protein J7641_06535 [Cyanobacteria bacterium SID2]|nr:hypothetical protein [Cyanobacteria bacterium SID2]
MNQKDFVADIQDEPTGLIVNVEDVGFGNVELRSAIAIVQENRIAGVVVPFGNRRTEFVGIFIEDDPVNTCNSIGCYDEPMAFTVGISSPSFDA